MNNDLNTIKIESSLLNGEARGNWAIMALVAIALIVFLGVPIVI